MASAGEYGAVRTCSGPAMIDVTDPWLTSVQGKTPTWVLPGSASLSDVDVYLSARCDISPSTFW